MQELDKEIENRFCIDIKNIIPYRDAYIINTSEGRKLLKRSVLSPDRILFIHEAKEHLYNNGFKHIDRFMCTGDGGDPFTLIDDRLFTVLDLIDGRECNFDNMSDVISAAKALASMHKATNGFVPSAGCKKRDELGNLPSYFSKRLDDIKRLKNIARKEGSRFDYLFLSYYDYFYSIGESAIKEINCSRYNELVKAARSEGIFCHHDFTYHNIICGENRTSIVNFDYCCFELKVYDLANFIRRKMRKCNWGLEEAKIILDKYCFIENLGSDEIEVLKIILKFPQKFWRVANKYYNSKRSWTEKSYLSKLQEVIDEIEYHSRFMDKFETLF